MYSALNSTNPNRTLGCGYVDTDNIFKTTGFDIYQLSDKLVTCMASHLTPIGVQEYTSMISKLNSSNASDITALSPYKPIFVVDMWNSWAIWVCISLIVVMGPLIYLGVRVDRHDKKIYNDIRHPRQKLFVNVFLDETQKAKK